jgi:hypothetical protein
MTNDEEFSKSEYRRISHAERSAAESKDPGAAENTITTRLKAWPRGLRSLRCSLDFARNDVAIFVIRH